MAIEGKSRPGSAAYLEHFDKVFCNPEPCEISVYCPFCCALPGENYERTYASRPISTLVLLPAACDDGQTFFQNDQKFCALCGAWMKDRAA